MAAWAGFSDEELRRLQMKDQPASNPGQVQGRGRKPTQTSRSRQQLQRERALKLATQVTDGSDALPAEQKLTKPQTPSSPPASSSQPVVNSRKEEPVVMTTKQSAVSNHAPPEPPPPEIAPPVVMELEKEEVELREKTRLEKLQEEQRVMEEKNKQKKALLAKTIAEKSKQTQAEAVKLKRIQRELQALDDSVSSDINILRKLIEQASLDYSTAWKRFERAEAEYVAAKLSLHQRTEAKEQLTEHLCAIIQQNELRKAAKLEELMQQLQLSGDLDPADVEALQAPAPGGNPQTPQLPGGDPKTLQTPGGDPKTTPPPGPGGDSNASRQAAEGGDSAQTPGGDSRSHQSAGGEPNTTQPQDSLAPQQEPGAGAGAGVLSSPPTQGPAPAPGGDSSSAPLVEPVSGHESQGSKPQQQNGTEASQAPGGGGQLQDPGATAPQDQSPQSTLVPQDTPTSPS
ncbi:RAB6-interacting golgin isoform X2 [Engraulis encrasicolus]|uniref:RAB6-interacting golgin isoform X2 n=1 Tax=Engraulis encrasicolus TaxID=184585 RepID=UPI002FD4A655